MENVSLGNKRTAKCHPGDRFWRGSQSCSLLFPVSMRIRGWIFLPASALGRTEAGRLCWALEQRTAGAHRRLAPGTAPCPTAWGPGDFSQRRQLLERAEPGVRYSQIPQGQWNQQQRVPGYTARVLTLNYTLWHTNFSKLHRKQAWARPFSLPSGHTLPTKAISPQSKVTVCASSRYNNWRDWHHKRKATGWTVNNLCGQMDKEQLMDQNR